MDDFSDSISVVSGHEKSDSPKETELTELFVNNKWSKQPLTGKQICSCLPENKTQKEILDEENLFGK